MKIILQIIALLALVPSFLGFPVIVVTCIIGFIKKDFTYFKKFIKIWGISLLILVLTMFAFGIFQAISSMK